ncbi:MAG: O-acetyl-ADP-ribose deacetylase [Patescibacteria group bacterium]
MTRITTILGDITQQKVDAIVNAANPRLSGGGGVDGAIHKAAGPGLLKECQTLGGCKVGEAKITKGYNLPVKFVIHTVGPVYRGLAQDAELLALCYRNSLDLALKNKVRTIAFPAISTGAYGYPKEEAEKIALHTVKEWVLAHPETLDEVRLVLFATRDIGGV